MVVSGQQVGMSEYGQLGDESTTDQINYVQVVSSRAKAITAGSQHSMMLKQHGSVWVTDHNGYGQLGDGTRTVQYALCK